LKLGKKTRPTRKTEKAVPRILYKLLERLAEAGHFREFYLAGGTGLALLLSHRRSVDLDFFSRSNRLDFTGRRRLLTLLRSFTGWSLIEEKEGTLQGRIGRVRVSFFFYPMPLVRPVIRKGKIRLASLEDIGLMKIGAIIGRGSRKDFIDLYEICQRVLLSRLLALGATKFKDSRDFTLQALKALCYFEDADQEPDVSTVRPLPWNKVRVFLTEEIRRLARRYLQKS